MEINPNYQAYLDSAFRDAIESYSHAQKVNKTPLPPELRALIRKTRDWTEKDEISDELMAIAGENIWFDAKRTFRLVMLRGGMDSEQSDELKLSNLPPLPSLGSYSVKQNDQTITVSCELPSLSGSGETLHAAIKDLYHAIRNEYFDDDYRPELDPRNWGRANPMPPEHQACLRHVIENF